MPKILNRLTHGIIMNFIHRLGRRKKLLLHFCRYNPYFVATCVLLLTLRLSFFIKYRGAGTGQLLPDSREYLTLSQNFMFAYGIHPDIYSDLSVRRTPIYPIILHVLAENTFVIGVLQHFLVLFISAVTYMLSRLIFGKSVAKISSIFVLIEPSVLSQSSVILSETVFLSFFIYGIFKMVLTILNESRKTGIEAGIFLSLAMLTIPIAVVVIPLIIVLMIRVSYRKSGLKCSAAVLLSTYLIWSFRNYLATGYFGFSSQQSTNLHLYEGSGAVAISMNMPLEQVQQYEYSQIQEFLGSSPSLQQLTDYQMIRGMELILNFT
jgi:hypothetical protein